MSRRSEQLELIARNFIQVHDEWAQDDNRSNPDETYWDAASAVVQAFETGDIPGEIRVLADAANKFSDEVDVFDNREDENKAYPREEFWRAVDGLRRAVTGPKRRELPPLETIKELASLPYMQHVQIARMYGFIDKRGKKRGVDI